MRLNISALGWCSVVMIVLPKLACPLSILISVKEVKLSKPLVISSKKSTLGSGIKFIPMAVLFFSPPESPEISPPPTFTFRTSDSDKSSKI